MKIDLERETEIGVGDIVITQCKSDAIRYYLIIDSNENEDTNTRLLIDLNNSDVRCYGVFGDKISDYINDTLEEDILEIIKEYQVTLTRNLKGEE